VLSALKKSDGSLLPVTSVQHMAARCSSYCVTCFDFNDFAVPDMHPNFKYMVYQVETCPETSRWHIQGYLELKRAASLLTVRTMFLPSEVHLEPRRGTRAQARDYCMKEESRAVEPIEFGEWIPDKQGQRTDLIAAFTKIREHQNWRDVVNDPDLFPILARHGKWAEQIWAARPRLILEPEIRLYSWQETVLELLRKCYVKRRIIWIWSEESGTGKSTFYDYCCSKFNVLRGARWIDTIYLYDGHDIVWFDRTRAESESERLTDDFYSDLERWSSGGNQVSTKYVPITKLVGCHVVVTANCAPNQLRLPERFFEVLAVKEDAEMEDEKSPRKDEDSSMYVDEDFEKEELFD